MKNVILLGATGQMGRFCLDAVSSSPIFNLVAISGKTNTRTIKAISYMYDVPFFTNVGEESFYDFIKRVNEVYTRDDTIAINAVSGYSGFRASMALVDFGYDIVLANKETIVCGGKLFLDKAKEKGSSIIPIDSEMHALKCLIEAFDKDNISKYYITASGGPFLNLKRDELKAIQYEDAIKHPVWKMGEKISIDSATMVNKALEIVEASVLFNIPSDKIETVINKEGYVHSALQMNNGMIYPQFYKPTQKQAIKDALGIQIQLNNEINLTSPLVLKFEKPSEERFPIIKTAMKATSNQAMAIALNASDEKAVEMFKKGDIAFNEIDEYVIKVTESYSNYKIDGFDSIDRLNNLIINS